MATQIQVRRDTAANWSSVNPTLASGEIGFETDENKFKIGDGSTDYNSLPYAVDNGGAGPIGNALTDINSITSEPNSDLTLTADEGEVILNGDGGRIQMRLDGDNAVNLEFDGTSNPVVRSATNELTLRGGDDNEGFVKIQVGNAPILVAEQRTDGNRSLMTDAFIGAPEMGSTGGVNARQFTRQPQYIDHDTAGTVPVNFNNGTFALIDLSADFGIGFITNLRQGATGHIILRVPANADIAYDNTLGIDGAYLFEDGDSQAFTQSLPAGGTDTVDRYWMIRVHQFAVDQVSEPGATLFLENAIGPIKE